MREAESTVNAAFTHERDVSADAHQIEDALQPANHAEHDADAEENFDKLAAEFLAAPWRGDFRSFGPTDAGREVASGRYRKGLGFGVAEPRHQS